MINYKGPLKAHTPNSLLVGKRHQILVCQSCRHEDSLCSPGIALLEKLRAAIAATKGLMPDFEVSGTVCMAGCDRPCTIAWRATSKATWLFGDIDPDQDIDALIEFSLLYQRVEAGWCRAADRPGTAPARIPAALIVTGEGISQ